MRFRGETGRRTNIETSGYRDSKQDMGKKGERHTHTDGIRVTLPRSRPAFTKGPSRKASFDRGKQNNRRVEKTKKNITTATTTTATTTI